MLSVCLAAILVQVRKLSISPWQSFTQRCMHEVSQGRDKPNQPSLAGLFTSTYSKLTQICFGRGRVLFC